MFRRDYLSSYEAGACIASCIPILETVPTPISIEKRVIESYANSLIHVYADLLAVADYDQQILYIKCMGKGGYNLSQTAVKRINEVKCNYLLKHYTVKYITPYQLDKVAFKLTQKFIHQFKDNYEI